MQERSLPPMPASPKRPEAAGLPQLPASLAVVCHDAGACNLVLPWLDPCGGRLRALMQGPAEALFRARFPKRALAAHSHQLTSVLAGAELVLTGTGWASDLEHRARALARERGQRTVAVIDHWVNYAERFERGGEVVWPDEFWVTDDTALALARRTFAGATVRRFDNLYLQAQVEQVRRSEAVPRSGGVLYVLEPMRNDWGRGVAGEFQALDHFMQHRAHVGIAAAVPVRLRPHPSDAIGKYDTWIAAQCRRGADVGLDAHTGLAQAIAAHRWVAGCESFALVVALHAGREVLSTLPPWAPPCRLPQAGLRHLRELVAA
jgi:hypothetical protein